MTTAKRASIGQKPRRKHVLVLWLAAGLLALGLTVALWRALRPIQNELADSRGPQAPVSRRVPGSIPAPLTPLQELTATYDELLRQADDEHERDGTLGLFTTLTTVEALHRVADIFIKKPTLVTAIVLRKLVEQQRMTEKSSADVDALLARVFEAAAAVPAKSRESRGISAALTSDFKSLGLALQDPDPAVQMTATQRLVWSQFSSAMVGKAAALLKSDVPNPARNHSATAPTGTSSGGGRRMLSAPH